MDLRCLINLRILDIESKLLVAETAYLGYIIMDDYEGMERMARYMTVAQCLLWDYRALLACIG